MYSWRYLLVVFCASCVVFLKSAAEPAWKNCSRDHTCLELLRAVGRLSNGTRLQLGAGIALVASERTRSIVKRLKPLAVSPIPLSAFIAELFSDFVGGLELSFQVGDSSLQEQVKSQGQLSGHSSTTGRTRFKTSWLVVRMIAVMAFALLAGLSGKALITSILAMALSALAALRSSGFAHPAAAFFSPGRVAQYEIFAQPVYASAPSTHYYDHEHHHHTVSDPAPYSYSRRELDGNKLN